MDDDGTIDVEATCPEGEIMPVYIDKKKTPAQLNPPNTNLLLSQTGKEMWENSKQDVVNICINIVDIRYRRHIRARVISIHLNHHIFAFARGQTDPLSTTSQSSRLRERHSRWHVWCQVKYSH